MLSKIQYLTLSIIIVTVSCTPLQWEVCDINGVVYKSLVENQIEWVSFFEQSEYSNETIKIRINNFNYGIRKYATLSEAVTFYLPTNTGIPASLLGESGYFYTEDDVLEFDDDRFKILKLSDNIYCYERFK